MLCIITNYTCWVGVWFDSEPMKYTQEVQDTFNKMHRNFRRGLVDREPELIILD